jgi:hypothetical protein
MDDAPNGYIQSNLSECALSLKMKEKYKKKENGQVQNT